MKIDTIGYELFTIEIQHIYTQNNISNKMKTDICLLKPIPLLCNNMIKQSAKITNHLYNWTESMLIANAGFKIVLIAISNKPFTPSLIECSELYSK